MKFLKFLIFGILSISVLLSSTFLFYNKTAKNNFLEDDVFNNLIAVAESRANYVKSYFSEREEDILFLSKTDSVAHILGKKGSSDEKQELKRFQEKNKYKDLFLINESGEIVWSVFSVNGITAQFEKNVRDNIIFNEIYEKSRNSLEVEFSTIKLDNKKALVFLTVPVFDEHTNENNGFLILQIENDILNDIVSGGEKGLTHGEIYLIDENNFNLTPLKIVKSGENGDIANYYSKDSREITSKNIETCLGKREGTIDNIRFFKNYVNEDVFGTYQYVSEIDCCILVEINKDKFLKNVSLGFNNTLLIFVISNLSVLFIVILVFVILSKTFVFSERKCKLKKKNHLFCRMIILLFFLIIAVINGVWLYKIYLMPDNSFSSLAYSNLNNIIEIREEQIEGFLDEREADIEMLTEFSGIKNILKQKTSFDRNDVKRDTDYFSDVVVKEVENYLKENPKLTLDNLMKSREFREIAVQQIGKDGYSAVSDINAFVIFLHNRKELENINLNDILPKDHALLEIMRRCVEDNNDNYGNYLWVDKNGVERNKHITIKEVGIKTADKKSLAVSATVYEDEYVRVKGVPAETEEYLDSFRKTSAYHNILLVSPDNHIVYMAKDMEKLGTNLRYDKTGLGDGYKEYLKKDDNIYFFGPFSYHYQELALKMALVSPVYDEGNFLGSIILIFDMSEVSKIVSDLAGLGDSGESYIVDRNGYLISPLRFKYFDFLVQSIKTENVSKCFSQYRDANRIGFEIEEYMDYYNTNSDIDIFQNYKGEDSIGVYLPISRLDWCLLAEISSKEVLDIPQDNKKKNELLILIVMSIVMVSFIAYKGMCIAKNCTIKMKK